jgi:hypothetical protein
VRGVAHHADVQSLIGELTDQYSIVATESWVADASGDRIAAFGSEINSLPNGDGTIEHTVANFTNLDQLMDARTPQLASPQELGDGSSCDLHIESKVFSGFASGTGSILRLENTAFSPIDSKPLHPRAHV